MKTKLLCAVAAAAAVGLSGMAEEAFSSDVTMTCECRPRGGVPNALAKLRAGGPVRIAYLGGSITAANGWRPKTLAWFRSAFPKAQIEEINATISGTGSDYGAVRLPGDVLSKKPDLLFVEFRVNGSVGFDVHSTEGIVRQTFAADPATDICFVYTLNNGQLVSLGKGIQTRFGQAMERVCDHYGIPSIDFAPQTFSRRRTKESRIYSRFVYLPEYEWRGHEAVFTVKKVPEGQRCILGQFLVVGHLAEERESSVEMN